MVGDESEGIVERRTTKKMQTACGTHEMVIKFSRGQRAELDDCFVGFNLQHALSLVERDQDTQAQILDAQHASRRRELVYRPLAPSSLHAYRLAGGLRHREAQRETLALRY